MVSFRQDVPGSGMARAKSLKAPNAGISTRRVSLVDYYILPSIYISGSTMDYIHYLYNNKEIFDQKCRNTLFTT